MTSKNNPSFSFLISDAGRLVGKRFDQRAKSVLNLSRAQCSVLSYLDRNPGINQAQLADLLGVTPISIARLLDRMEAGGWIVRDADATDRRMRRLSISDKARSTLAEAKAVGQKVASEALDGLSADERRELTGLLEKVRRNLMTVLGEAVKE
ncbi:MAG: MarR family winged helix-turn-helix transcriptional regulator [Burkholderiaceae bacterium]